MPELLFRGSDKALASSGVLIGLELEWRLDPRCNRSSSPPCMLVFKTASILDAPVMSSSTDPLLPSYERAPEISFSGTRSGYSEEINYGSTRFTSAPAASPSEDYHQLESKPSTERNNDSQDGAARTIENGMAKLFRTVCGLIFFVVIVVVFASAFRSVDGPVGGPSPPARRSIEQRVDEILTTTPLIDGHNDLAILIRGRYKNDIYSEDFIHDFEQGGMPLHVDLPRMRNGSIGGAFWSAFVVCPANASYDMSDKNHATAAAHTVEQIDLLRNLQDEYAHDFSRPTEASNSSGREYMLAKWQSSQSFFGPISIEGLHQVLPSAPMSSLRSYYALGVRMATLTWNCHNAFADAALVQNDFTEPVQVVAGISRPDEGPVTKRGRAVIREMNRMGMIVDISHTSYWTQKAVLQNISQAPVVFSHSSAYALCPHPRNVRDDVLDLVRMTQSLVMVNFSPEFISCESPLEDVAHRAGDDEPRFKLPIFYDQNNTLHQVARHIKYIGDRIGYDYVGLGTDFDGMGQLTPRGLEGVDKFRDLLTELLRMDITDENVKKITGANILRVWAQVDTVSSKMKKEGSRPALDDASGF